MCHRAGCPWLQQQDFIIGEAEIVIGLLCCESLAAIVADGDQPPRAGLGRLFKAVFANLRKTFRKPADGTAAAAGRIRTVMFHFRKGHPGQLAQYFSRPVKINPGLG